MIFLFIFFFIQYSKSVEHCMFEKGVLYSVPEIQKCLLSFPYDDTTSKMTFEAAYVILNSYPFRDILQSPPQPYANHQYNITFSLEQTKQKIFEHYFSNDYEFHTEIHSLFSRLHDGHTQYTPPLCYALFSLVLPFPFKASLSSFFDKQSTDSSSSLSQTLSIGKYSPQYSFITRQYAELTGIDFFKYENYQIHRMKSRKIAESPWPEIDTSRRKEAARHAPNESGPPSDLFKTIQRFFKQLGPKTELKTIHTNKNLPLRSFNDFPSISANDRFEWCDPIEYIYRWASTTGNTKYGSSGLGMTDHVQFNLALQSFFHIRPLSLFPQALFEGGNEEIVLEVESPDGDGTLEELTVRLMGLVNTDIQDKSVLSDLRSKHLSAALNSPLPFSDSASASSQARLVPLSASSDESSDSKEHASESDKKDAPTFNTILRKARENRRKMATECDMSTSSDTTVQFPASHNSPTSSEVRRKESKMNIKSDISQHSAPDEYKNASTTTDSEHYKKSIGLSSEEGVKIPFSLLMNALLANLSEATTKETSSHSTKNNPLRSEESPSSEFIQRNHITGLTHSDAKQWDLSHPLFLSSTIQMNETPMELAQDLVSSFGESDDGKCIEMTDEMKGIFKQRNHPSPSHPLEEPTNGEDIIFLYGDSESRPTPSSSISTSSSASVSSGIVPPSNTLQLPATLLVNGEYVQTLLVKGADIASFLDQWHAIHPAETAVIKPPFGTHSHSAEESSLIEGDVAVMIVSSFVADPPPQFEAEVIAGLKVIGKLHDEGLASAEESSEGSSPGPIRYFILDMRSNGGGLANLAFGLLPMVAPFSSFASQYLLMPGGYLQKNWLTKQFADKVFGSEDVFGMDYGWMSSKADWYEKGETLLKRNPLEGKSLPFTEPFRVSLTRGYQDGMNLLKKLESGREKSTRQSKNTFYSHLSLSLSEKSQKKASRMIATDTSLKLNTPTLEANVLLSSPSTISQDSLRYPFPTNTSTSSTTVFTSSDYFPFFDMNHFVVLSDGYCFSGCAMTTKILQLTRRAKVAVMGGLFTSQKNTPLSAEDPSSPTSHPSATIRPSPFDPSSAAGANVIQPQFNIPLSCRFTTAFYQIYFDHPVDSSPRYSGLKLDPRDFSYPAQFLYTQADLVLPIWDFKSAGEAYSLAVEALAMSAAHESTQSKQNEQNLKENDDSKGIFSCKEGMFVDADASICPDVENGVSGVMCSKDSSVPLAKRCGIAWCNDGYMLDFLENSTQSSRFNFASTKNNYPQFNCSAVPYIPLDIADERSAKGFSFGGGMSYAIPLIIISALIFMFTAAQCVRWICPFLLCPFCCCF